MGMGLLYTPGDERGERIHSLALPTDVRDRECIRCLFAGEQSTHVLEK
jgi:hypothetical protein